MITDYHSQYFAYELTRRRSSAELEKFASIFLNATVDLNPHQIDAALFAFRSPLSYGAILADEVGLGKTIEAGLAISQLWAERRRKILCIVPASIRKQWMQELKEKFFIEAVILESSIYNHIAQAGSSAPFDQHDRVIICSYNFARSKEKEIHNIPWDLVVIDEAHRLRNVYKKGNKIAKSIQESIGLFPKLLLTATPLQNSLMELYGLISFIDPHLFGSEDAFREQYVRFGSDLPQEIYLDLRRRIKPVCQRTLRRQVQEYVRYTNRMSITQDFTPTEDEVRLYEAVSTYLQRPQSFALPSGQRQLLTLVLRKILASSTYAIAATLNTMVERLESLQTNFQNGTTIDITGKLDDEYESLAETQEEWTEEEEAVAVKDSNNIDFLAQQEILENLKSEIAELRNYKELATSIVTNAKGQALLSALRIGFAKAADIAGTCKALVFTESRRTQQYLKSLLESNEYAGQVVTFNGSNNEADSRRIYKDWLCRHQNDDMVSGSVSADMRSALVDEFRDRASIMLATESGAEGINLQFCNLIINYDLPWNPQRIEQRIGRCHRYGQKHDVIVINFLNRRNAADQRVYELLHDKFQLFDGVFGTSDEILGALGSGADFEKRINDIYQNCRTTQEINQAFDQLQLEFDERIKTRMNEARSKLMEHFDEDVHKRLKLNNERTNEQLDRYSEFLWSLTKHEIGVCATFGEGRTFLLKTIPSGIELTNDKLGQYRFITERNGMPEHNYRVGHPLAEQLIDRAKKRCLIPREVKFQYTIHRETNPKISLLEGLQKQTGWLTLSILTIEALEQEEYLIFSACLDDQRILDQEVCEKFFTVPGEIGIEAIMPLNVGELLNKKSEEVQVQILSRVAERNRHYFEEEIEKLDAWADDLKEGLELELKQMDKEIKGAKREARQIIDLDTKVSLHKKAKDIERKRNDKRRQLFEAQDEIEQQKEQLISTVETRLRSRTQMTKLFEVRWCIV